jgi:2-methoxy-6-polyprenyl-1,4-benzoquinol methylase
LLASSLAKSTTHYLERECHIHSVVSSRDFDTRGFHRVYDQYSFSVIPMLGSILAGDRDSYQYLVESIRKFPPQAEFARMIQDAGFVTGAMQEGKGGAWTDLWGGIACIHKGVKV